MQATGIDFHLASDKEKQDLFKNIHATWGKGLTLDEHLADCHINPVYTRPRWYVGTIQDRVVVSLGAYPLQMNLDGHVYPSIGFGSIFTIPDMRQKGYAAGLIDYVERKEAENGARYALLYADDIAPYYKGLGYFEAGSFVAKCPEVRANKGLPLEEIFHPDWFNLSDLYDGYHGTLSCSIFRDPSYARYIMSKDKKDSFFWLGSMQQSYGYVRVEFQEDELILKDYALVADTDAMVGVMLASLMTFATQREMSSITAWLPNRPICRKWFNVEMRPRATTMLKPLGRSLIPSADMLQDMQYIQPIDYF